MDVHLYPVPSGSRPVARGVITVTEASSCTVQLSQILIAGANLACVEGTIESCSDDIVSWPISRMKAINPAFCSEEDLGLANDDSIKLDALHAMQRIEVPMHHGWAADYRTALRNAIFQLDTFDMANVTFTYLHLACLRTSRLGTFWIRKAGIGISVGCSDLTGCLNVSAGIFPRLKYSRNV